MILSFLGHFIALLAAGIAVAGDTWDSKARGLRKLTLVGRLTIVIALIGFGLSGISTYNDWKGQAARRAAAIDEIDIAWRDLVSPYRLMLWQLDSEQSNPDEAMIERLLNGDALQQLNRIDLRGEAPHHHGPWFDNICGPAQRGHDALRRSQTIYVGVIDAELITAMKDVATDYMIQAMMTLAPCGAWSPEGDYPLHLESITNFRELPRYLEALLALRRELNKR